jgi:hypothetical protein
MAGDWIKMRVNLWDDPRISALVESTDSSEAAVIGALYWLWCAADQHSEDGIMAGLTLKQLDRKVVMPGFAAGLVAIGWISATENGLRIERFGEHNGASAKNRMTTAKRVAAHRDRSGNGASNGETVTKPVSPALAPPYLDTDTDLDKSKEPSAPAAPPPGDGGDAVPKWIRAPKSDAPKTTHRFAEFWAVYPVKKGRADALKKWASKGLDAIADQLIAHVRRMEREDAQWRRGFIPHGSTYINAEGWQDEPAPDPDDISKRTTPSPAPEAMGAKAALKRTETPLAAALAHIRHQFSLGAYGEGEAAEVEASRLIAEARKKHGEGGDADRG